MPSPPSITNTFNDLLAAAAPEPAQIASRLREIVIDIHPETVEVIYLGYNSASYGLGPKKNSEAYCYIMPQKDRVNLGFYFGVKMADPEGLLEGAGKLLRHVKVRTLEAADGKALRQLIQDSVEERRVALFP